MKLIILILIFPCLVFGQFKKFPIIISDLKAEHKLKSLKENIGRERQVQYIGIYKDTLNIDKNSFDLLQEYKIPAKEGRYLYNYPFYADKGINIFIDTTQIVALKEVIWKGKSKAFKIYDGFPVIIQNITDSTAVVGFGRNIPIVIEALDVKNQWKPLENNYIYKSGTGLHNILLKPQHIICVLIPKYKGTFKTQLRLRLKNNVSKSFWGEISKKQFLGI